LTTVSNRDAETFDLIVLGGGAGGLTVVDQANQAGLRVALVERDRPGGDCTYYGCVPTKTLVTTAKLLYQMRRSVEFGLPPVAVTPDFGAVMAHVRRVIAEVSANGSFQPWEDRGVRPFVGEGRFVTNRELVVRLQDGREQTIRGEKFVIATGSRPEVPAIRGLPAVGYLTNVDMVALSELPRRLIVIGGGPIGVEFAQVMRRLGSEVTIVELKGRILPREDEEAALLLQACLADEGVRIVCGTDVAEVCADGD
jgi:pyruvate/2-oxoglutarate dehydrogenase complex dihydrolipoamide dehydrogenase (E3) component